MTARLRENAIAVVLALVGVATMVWLGLYGWAWTDYDNEARPALDALVAGHFNEFLRLAPAYGGSLELRAPFALAAPLFGGGELAIYRMVALPCLLASAALGVWLLSKMRSLERSTLARAAVLGLCVVNPLTLRALELGHPEDLLGAVLCGAAVLCAERDRATWAGVLLGAAIANKEWALLAVGPVLLACPRRHLIRTTVWTVVVAAALYAPLLAATAGRSGGVPALAASHTGVIFQPWQAWWFFGQHGHVVRGLFGNLKVDYRAAPAWISGVTRPVILALAVVLPLAYARLRPRAQRAAGEALLVLALIMLVRCLLDPWDTVYYPLPFVFALVAWEGLHRAEPAVRSLAAASIAWIVFQELPDRISPDAQSLAFLAVALPATIALAVRLYRPPSVWRQPGDATRLVLGSEVNPRPAAPS